MAKVAWFGGIFMQGYSQVGHSNLYDGIVFFFAGRSIAKVSQLS